MEFTSTVAARLPVASRHVAHIDAGDHKEAAVVVQPHYVATYAHEEHTCLTPGTQVMIKVHDAASPTRKAVQAKVVHRDPQLDLVLLKVEEELEAPVLSGQLYGGQRYFVLGQSAQAQPDDVSVSHAQISAVVLDKLSHVRGDSMAGQGDSGGGAFAVDTGALIGMVVGSDVKTRKAVLLPSSIISGVITSNFPPQVPLV